ncbi:sensor histidine kinase [Solimicrobium silvestre]|uniref:Histidine kinase n=1 Tax=Solimicrobium silvestre TaxID=2099400 RepID=A0A2S9GYX7_9BURK|nr:histidine kinase [Solimicrobium silvestre]PRC92917.1 Histidine kinase [Solimicrobium silvestre]
MDQQSTSIISADNPLPSKILGKYGGWGARAQQYPIFSQTWFKYRAMSYLLPMFLLALLLTFVCILMPIEDVTFSFTLSMALVWGSVAVALLLGRWLAVLISKRDWPEKRIGMGIVAAVILGIVIAVTLNRIGNFYEKKYFAEHQQDLNLKRKTDVSVGIQIDTHNNLKKNPTLAILNYLLVILFFSWLGGGLDVVAYFRQRRAMKDALVEQRLTLYKKERNEAELRLSVLASQIEPHFLFNTLSGVRSAILSDPQMGVAIIDNLVEYLRATIPQLRNDGSCAQVKLGAQLQAIRAYLGVIKFRIPRLSFDVYCDPVLAEQFIPPLMLISLVENAVKHGIELKKGPVYISVLAQKIGLKGKERLVLTVSDNGLGFSGITSGTGIGLANIRERLKQLYDDHASLSLEENDGGGVCACITIPANTDLIQ